MSLPPEEQARANFYGLLSRLFYGAPDAGLLAALGQAEYEAAFIGTGKAAITLYTSAYSVRYTNEMPLAALRGELAALGLTRRIDAAEPEDHIAALCDVMRYFIAEQGRDLGEQRRFFERWIDPIVEPLCDAIEASELTAFYKRVGRMAKAFFSLERSAFEMI
jgi:TorA maturation chaperone TorD